MLQFKLGDYILDKPADSSIDFEFNQSAFVEEIIKGSGSYDITFPPTPTNNKAFQYAKFIYSPKGVKIYDVLVHSGENTIINGSLAIWESNAKGYVTTIEKSDFPFLTNDLSIKELNWATINLGTTTQDVLDYAKLTTDKDNDSYPVRFPEIYAPDWYKDENTFFLEEINDWDGVAETYRHNTISADAGDTNFYSMLPLVTFYAVLKQIADDYGYSIKGSALNHYEIKNTVFFNNHSLDQFGDSYAQLDSGVTDTVTSEAADSNYDVLSSVYTPSAAGTHLISLEGTKSVNVTNTIFALCYDNGGTDTVLQVIGNVAEIGDFSINVEYYITDLLTDVYVVAYKSNGLDPDATITDTDIRIENIGNNLLNVFAKEINIPNHLPDITVAEFLVLYKAMHCLTIDFNKTSGELIINLREDLLSAEVKQLENVNEESINLLFSEKGGFNFSWSGNSKFDFTSDKYEGEFDYRTELPDANDVNQYALVKSELAWYKVEYDDTTNRYSWVWQESNFTNYELGSGELEGISLSATPVPMNSKGFRVLPYQQDQAYSPLFAKGEKTDKVEILIFHGLQSDSSYDYPFASSNSYQYTLGETLTGLQFEGIKGLFAERLKEWYDAMLYSDEVEVQVYFKSLQINELFEKRLYYKGVLFLLSELETSIDNKGIKPSELTLRKVV